MTVFSAPDGTELAYRQRGTGDPLVCLPGGPMQDAGYLDDLGGLSRHRRLILLDPRGTGRSAIPDDTNSYRCDRLVEDVEALRAHLNIDQMVLLGHSAGANLASLYVMHHPERVHRLALVTPSLRAVGIDVPASVRQELAQLRKDEGWFQPAAAALSTITAGGGTTDDWEAITPFYYGRWDATARAHHANMAGKKNQDAAMIFGGDGVFNADHIHNALGKFDAPTLLLAGELDLNTPSSGAAKFAGLFPNADLVVQPGAGHYPWLDDARRFVTTMMSFLDADSAVTIRPRE